MISKRHLSLYLELNLVRQSLSEVLPVVMDHAEETCPVCSEHIDIYAVGACDHPICYKCSTRMRVLCDQMYCPICRTNLPQVMTAVKVSWRDRLRTFIVIS